MPTDTHLKHIQFGSTFSHKQSEISQSTGKLTGSKGDLHDKMSLENQRLKAQIDEKNKTITSLNNQLIQ